MHLETKHLHSRQIFRFIRLASGETWRSPSTGQELTIIGGRSDAEDPDLQGPLFAHEYHDGNRLSIVYPELPELFEGRKFKMARRVSEDGWCRPENQVICIPFDGRSGVYGVDLVGYGPTEWLPTGVPMRVYLERTIEPWRTLAIWRSPERMVSIASLQYGWVIRSEQFARASTIMGKTDARVLTMYMNQEKILDEKRGQARYVVEQIMPREDIEWDSGADDYTSLDIRLRRLADTGSYDPHGEVIELNQRRHRENHRYRDRSRNDPFQPVELVGQMAFDGSGVTETLPKPLIF